MSDESERRKNDETFKYRIVESQAEIKTLIESTRTRIEDLSRELNQHTSAITELRHAMWGGPGLGDVGLIETHRRMAKNWTIAIAVCAFIFSALGKIVAPLYDKAVADWAFNSPSEKWLRESKRPRITHYHIRETVKPEEEDQ